MERESKGSLFLYLMLDARYWMLDTGCWIPETCG